MARRDTPRGSGSGRSSRSRKAKPFWRRWLGRLFVWGLAFALLGAIVLGVAVAMTERSLPSYQSLKSSQTGQMIVVRANDGSELVTLGPSYGKWVPYAQIPKTMTEAIVSTEDRRYRDHFGIDPLGIARSIMVRVETGHWRQGGSTITQQLARNIFLNNSKTFARKAREAVLALALEQKFSKDQILELYLNKVYFGGGAYGIDAASRKFFGHPAQQLTLGESAIVAGLVKAPSHYSPTADAEAGKERAHVVLGLMVRHGAITQAQADAVNLDKVKLAKETGQNSVRYFTDWALPQLDVLLPENDKPIEVWTTLDPGMQRAATAAIKANAPKGAQGALVSLDRDGAVLAMVGGTDYVTSNYNRATDAMRQPGSAWKLFVYMAALEAGYTPDDRVVDEPVTIDGWSPKNAGNHYAGAIDVRSAFAYSKNTVAAQLGNEVGFAAVAGMARRFGITTPINTMPAMVLGSSEVRVIDMTRAFAGVEAKGQLVTPYGIRKVTTTDGEVLYQHQPNPPQVLVPPYVVAGITDLLQTTVNTGTGRAAQIGRPVAGKTGTTSSDKDGWFVGFSSGITTGVWMGRDDAKPVPGLHGGAAPARAFAAYMRYATAKRPVEHFDTEVKLPQWQLEPDDEAYQGDPGDYYYVDEQGNLVDPSHAGQQDQPQRPADGQPLPSGPDGLVPAGPPPPAAGEDFLDRATGKQDGQGTTQTGALSPDVKRNIAPRPRMAPTPTPIPTRTVAPPSVPRPSGY
ncbi:PBP1A family penicillin-binding protein [Novosphingobium sp. ZN18A2]|uniref:transglycosylase domain-containing protein n=1 Tax=Novosphingobium sp. ZN18A2 TaxID=3079861 RepID=UPI0030CD9137